MLVAGFRGLANGLRRGRLLDVVECWMSSWYVGQILISPFERLLQERLENSGEEEDKGPECIWWHWWEVFAYNKRMSDRVKHDYPIIADQRNQSELFLVVWESFNELAHFLICNSSMSTPIATTIHLYKYFLYLFLFFYICY